MPQAAANANASRKRASLSEPVAAAVVLDPTPVAKEDGRKKRRKASAVTPAIAAEPETEYERLRAARIAANQERLQALNIDKLSSALQVKHEKERVVRGLSKAKTRRGRGAEAVEPRKSLRVQGMAPDGTLAAGIADERRDGTVVLASGGVYAVTETPRMTRPTGTLPFKSINGKEDTDAAFLATLRSGVRPSGGASTLPTEALKRLTLAEKDVAKVCPKGITHMDFMPRDDLLLVAAGDKEGNVGLRVPPDAEPAAPAGDAMQTEDEDDDGAADGVILFRPFSQYVSGVRFAKLGAQRLFACSYDGSVRSLDVSAGQWLESFVSTEQEWSSFDITADGNTAYLGNNDGGLTICDLRSATAAGGAAFSAHTHRINCTSLDPGGNMLATSASDATVCLWDVRKGLSRSAKPLHQLDHGKSCHGAYWAPQGPARVLTTSYNDTICVFGADGKAITKIKHNNATGKWLLPFRAIWTPAGDGIVVGSMVRETEVFSAANGARIAHHSSEFLTAVPTRHACHQSISAVAAGTASGRVHVWRA